MVIELKLLIGGIFHSPGGLCPGEPTPTHTLKYNLFIAREHLLVWTNPIQTIRLQYFLAHLFLLEFYTNCSLSCVNTDDDVIMYHILLLGLLITILNGERETQFFFKLRNSILWTCWFIMDISRSQNENDNFSLIMSRFKFTAPMAS